jgi:hypothetical protein
LQPINTAVCSNQDTLHYASEVTTAVRNYEYSSIVSYVNWLRNADVGEGLLPPFLAVQHRTPHIECFSYGNCKGRGKGHPITGHEGPEGQ